MKPLDLRLLRTASAARSVLGFGALLGVVRTLAIIGWCWFLAQAIAAVALPFLVQEGGATGRVAEGVAPVSDIPQLLALALLSVCVRSAAGWGIDALAARGAVRVKAQLRNAALNALDERAPDAPADVSHATLATTLGRGLDALDGYFAQYIPQLILTAVATPLLVLVLLFADPVSGITVIIVFPIIPLFMALIGLATQAVQDRQWKQLQHLSSSFLDVVTGLTTLKLFRREHRQRERIAAETDAYRKGTMRVLRVTFLSGFVLDLAGTFSIALVAVTVGTRLVNGEFPLALGLVILLLLPEVFIPIRQVGAAFHASTEGLAAAEDVFQLIAGTDQADDAGVHQPAGQHTGSRESATVGMQRRSPRIPGESLLSFEDVQLRRGAHTVVSDLNFACAAGEVVALTGPSGAGKSTVIAAALGALEPTSGTLQRPQLQSWAGQRPGLIQGTVGSNLMLGGTEDLALARTVLDEVGLERLSLDVELGALGSGLSGGQAQRVAVARALFRARQLDTDVLLLDEPSSALDVDSERLIAQAMRVEAEAGRAVLCVSHRPALIERADRVIALQLATEALAHTEEEL